MHEGQRVTHPRLHRAFLRGVRFLDDEGVFVVQIGHFRGQIEIEDVPFWATSYDVETGRVELTDGSSEPLAVESLTLDPDGAFRCQVKGRFPARFTRAAQALLLDAVEPQGEGYALRTGSGRVRLPTAIGDGC